MPIERYFLNEPFEQGKSYLLKGPEFHHLAHVMRTKTGDRAELVDGKGRLAEAVVSELKKEHAILRVETVTQAIREPYRLILAQAIPKPNRLDFILEKGTELGVDAFWIFPGQLSIKKELFPAQRERAHALTVAAMKQCGRLFLPEIFFKPFITEWNSLDETVAFFGDLEPNAPFLGTNRFDRLTGNGSFLFLTGPESGLTIPETDKLVSLGALGVKLHRNVLRTDTASLMALSLMIDKLQTAYL